MPPGVSCLRGLSWFSYISFELSGPSPECRGAQQPREIPPEMKVGWEFGQGEQPMKDSLHLSLFPIAFFPQTFSPSVPAIAWEAPGRT